jgi:hypothetical protein
LSIALLSDPRADQLISAHMLGVGAGGRATDHMIIFGDPAKLIVPMSERFMTTDWAARARERCRRIDTSAFRKAHPSAPGPFILCLSGTFSVVGLRHTYPEYVSTRG